MVASYALLIMSFLSAVVHADLWLVIRYQKHLFEPLLALIPTKQRKTYQGAYRNSLKRKFYCVQDKVDVSGTSFTACFTVLYAALFISNLMSEQEHISGWAFYSQALFYYLFMLYCLGSYRDMRELCFYCKFEMYQGGLHCLYAFTVASNMYHWPFLAIVVIVFSCVMFVRMAHKEEREEERIRKLERAQYESKAKRGGEGPREEATSSEYDSGAYLSKRSKQEKVEPDAKVDSEFKPRPPPKAWATAAPSDGSQLLETVNEEEGKEEEEIEVIECPGVDGRQKQAGMAHRVNPMMNMRYRQAPRFNKQD